MRPVPFCYNRMCGVSLLAYANKKKAPDASSLRKMIHMRLEQAARQVGLAGSTQQEVSGEAQSVVQHLVCGYHTLAVVRVKKKNT